VLKEQRKEYRRDHQTEGAVNALLRWVVFRHFDIIRNRALFNGVALFNATPTMLIFMPKVFRNDARSNYYYSITII
jgi:hypothetical protein